MILTKQEKGKEGNEADKEGMYYEIDHKVLGMGDCSVSSGDIFRECVVNH